MTNIYELSGVHQFGLMYMYLYEQILSQFAHHMSSVRLGLIFPFNIDTIVSLTRMLFEYANMCKRYMSDSMKMIFSVFLDT